MDYELIILGAGTGGYVAAIKAAQSGKKVVLIEKEHLGGVCLNKGCIPTKTLLRSAEKWQDLHNLENYGLKVAESAFDWPGIMARKQSVITQMRSGVEKLLKANKVTLLQGTASVIDAHTVKVQAQDQEQLLTTENLIIATGSSPALPPIPGRTNPGVITSDELLELTQVPQSLIIVGAGVIGLEFAGIFSAFGCKVTLVEMLPSILPPSDVDLQRRMNLILRKEGITAKVNAAVKEIRPQGTELEVLVSLKGKEEILTAEKVLIATGRKPNFDQEELTRLGIAFTRKGITVNDHMETSVPGIYAVGDVNGLSMLAHSAEHQGLVAVDQICGGHSQMHYNAIPSCIFTHPEIASVGLTEQECKDQQLNVVISKFNFAGNGKAITLGETDGLVKLIADAATHKLLGCHILGPHASDLIMEATLAITKGLTAEDLTAAIHPHPTLSEAVSEAALGLFGSMLHQVSLKR